MVKLSDGTATNVVRKDSPAKVTAQVLDANNSPVSGTIVTFSTSLGVLTPSSGTVLTDASGNAIITLGAGDTIGADTLTASATVNSQTVTKSISYQVSVPDVRIGSLSGGTFVEGTLAVAVNPISAGGTTSVTANLVDSAGSPINFPATVTFTSNFASQGAATLSSPVTTSTGVATSTYTATGTQSGTDTITATVDGLGLTATASITVQGVSAGSIMFDKATPINISLKGMGGQETSVVSFQVKDALGNPKANEPVNFNLNTTVGGITLTPISASSDANGYVSTTVQAGTVATPVIVTATLANDSSISSSSQKLTVSTGVPHQNGFSLSVKTLNPEGFNIDGVQVPVTVRASDRFSNLVPDGTPISFRAEGGAIDASCQTVNGTCTVNWISQNPRPGYLGSPDPITNVSPGGHAFPGGGRVTITAFAVGEESFNDANGNGVFDDGDTFTDLPEAFEDWNENGGRDTSALFYEPFIDFNQSSTYDLGDGLYNGWLCKHLTLCSSTQSVNVRDKQVIVMSTSNAYIEVYQVDPTTNQIIAGPLDLINMPINGFVKLIAYVWDMNGNMMPFGTTISITTPIGTLSGTTSGTTQNTVSLGPQELGFSLKAGSQPDNGTFKVDVMTPGGTLTTKNVTVNVN